ncbi:hypothetical protein Tco_0160740 [Tanacetum coccineum]
MMITLNILVMVKHHIMKMHQKMVLQLINQNNINNNNSLLQQPLKLPILKKEEYDIWAMEMEHYLEYIDNDVWKKFMLLKRKGRQEPSYSWLFPRNT